MPTKRLANTFKAQTPLGQGLQALSQALFAGDGRNAELDAANIAHHKASIGKLGAETSAANLKREGFQKLSDTFRMIPRAQDAVREGAPQWAPGQGGVDMLNPDAPVSSAFQQQGNFDTSSKFLREAPAQAMSSALQAGHDPKNVSEAFRGIYALDPKTSDAEVFRAVVGAGGNPSAEGGASAMSIGDRDALGKTSRDAKLSQAITTTSMTNATTARGQDISAATQRRGQDMTDRRAGASSYKNYFDPENGERGRTLDGKTDMTSGRPLSAKAQVISSTIQDTSEGFGKNETSKVRSDIDKNEVATRQFEAAADEVLGMLQSPDAAKRVGMVGGINRVANGLRAQAVALLDQAGVKVEASNNPESYKRFFEENGIPAGEIRSAMLDLAFATASAREGGKLTDKDVLAALQTNGGDLQDPNAIIATINRSKAARRRDTDIRRQYLEGQYPDLRKGKGSGGGPVSGALGGGAPPAAALQAPPTAEDIAATAAKYGISEDEVRQKLGIR